jgi:hypothetical protein
MGVGFAPGGPYGRFWVMLFGCRPNVLPPVLLDGMLTVPDEQCGRGPDAFGRVEAQRLAASTDAAVHADWEPYTPERAWPSGQPAAVELRDTSGKVIQATANDPTGAPTELP